MTIHMRCEELLRTAEKLLRDADDEVAATSYMQGKARVKRRRNAINAACNALHRATRD